MSVRTYNQYCGVATALDLLGERWTLLVVRNLLTGPKRFKDLEDGLPGIGTGLLTTRLKHLQAQGLIERAVLPPPAGSAVYQLTAEGEALRPIVIELARWGLTQLGAPGERTVPTPDITVLAIETLFDPTNARGTDGIYELVIDGMPFRLQVQGGVLAIRPGHADAPRATVSTDTATLVALNNKTLDLVEAIGSKRFAVTGDDERVLRLARAFGLGSSS